jgi:hypothetical protein
MSRKKKAELSARIRRRKSKRGRESNQVLFRALIHWVLPDDALFSKDEFHGNIKWIPEQLVAQALIWSWQESKNVTDAFEAASEVCERIGLKEVAMTYTAFMNALNHYRGIFGDRLRARHQALAEEIGGPFFHTNKWVLIGFDGSRATAPRTVANEKAFCAPNYGHSNKAKYGKKKSKGLRRKRNKAHKTEPQEPQVWITMMWHMGLRLPWTWRLGPSNSSERGHVQEILEEEDFPENTLFCGDAGFVGYPLWSSILAASGDFLVRVGANVNLLSEHVNIKELGGGVVLCWPKDQIASGQPPLRLRLVQVQVGKTKMWMLTSVLDERKLTRKQIVTYYKMRWGIEVEFRGLKQTIDKHKLRCRNSDRLLAELDWSLRGMAIAELIALGQQIPKEAKRELKYDPKDRSLANTLRALRRCMRKLDKQTAADDGLLIELSTAFVQRYHNRTDKRARYRPKNPDIKPLGDPVVRKLTREEREKLRKRHLNIAA